MACEWEGEERRKKDLTHDLKNLLKPSSKTSYSNMWCNSFTNKVKDWNGFTYHPFLWCHATCPFSTIPLKKPSKCNGIQCTSITVYLKYRLKFLVVVGLCCGLHMQCLKTFLNAGKKIFPSNCISKCSLLLSVQKLLALCLIQRDRNFAIVLDWRSENVVL